MSALTTVRERRNWLIHLLYVRGDYEACCTVIEEVCKAANGLAEYPLFVKGLIRRQQGKVAESLTLFQAATALNPQNTANLKQVARSLFLLGRHKAAVDVYHEAERVSPTDWEVHHNKGLCYMYLKRYKEAEESFLRANDSSRHDTTFIQLAKVYTLQEKYKEAIDTYLEALDYSPDNTEMLTTIGLLYLRTGNNMEAFRHLGNSLTHDPRAPKTILAAGSMIQDSNEIDVALVKYRVAAVQTPNSAQLWNNIGMCFFSKTKYIAAVACLKRALYLDPFEWIIAYNLGIAHLSMGQYASAFHYLSASINLKPDFASAYMYLGITLARLGDYDNSCSAYEKSLSMEADHTVHLNFCISLLNARRMDRAREQYVKFLAAFQSLPESERTADQDVLEQQAHAAAALGIPLAR